MNLKSYLNLYTLLSIDSSTMEEKRAFGLEYIGLKDRPIKQLLAWIEVNKYQLVKPLLSKKVSTYLFNITFILVLVAFLFGVISGMTLLSYTGEEPVNVIYFIAMVIFVPLIAMILTLISILRIDSEQSVLVHISPAYWLEKMINFLPLHMQNSMSNLKINPLIFNWLIIKRSQLITIFFSMGLLGALLIIVITKDIAFAWSTTLNVSASEFYTFLAILSLPWSSSLPEAVPSLSLVEYSQYFRLGDSLSKEMINHASDLGQWWKFLALSTIFYAIILRLLLYVLVSIGLHLGIKKSFLALPEVGQLLRDMNEPIITTNAMMHENVFVPTSENYNNIVNNLKTSYPIVLGWAIDKKVLVVVNDSLNISSSQFYEVGGHKSMDEDNIIISKCSGEILFYVKGWEPPTMDIVDYLYELSKVVDKVILIPIGTMNDKYKIKQSTIDIWDRKLSTIKNNKLWLKR